MKIVVRIREPELAAVLRTAAESFGAELILIPATDRSDDPALTDALRSHPELLVVEYEGGEFLRELRTVTRDRNIAMLVICSTDAEAVGAARAEVDECVLVPIDPERLATRMKVAAIRGARVGDPERTTRTADYLRYEELLYDRFTGFPTLPVMMERGREMLDRRGRLTLLYVQFVRFAKLEETYGWQKLDDVLRTTANAVREFYDSQHAEEESLLMVAHAADDDFVFFTDLRGGSDAETRAGEVGRELEADVRRRVAEEFGEEIASLFSIYVGAATITRNPKIRTERNIYRGIREAANAATGSENRERRRKIADLRTTIREGAVYVDYHPIVVTATGEIFGYEALARGSIRTLRSPEVMFDVAEEANLVWELSRLCRQRAIEGVASHLEPEHLLFLNIDPHDFSDPAFRDLDPADFGIRKPERIVLEITERIAITDYVAFQEYLQTFREQGYRFAVDDAGSGYAGLGSIANLSPDFIKLDISLISGIDSNFMKQNLVETMVAFANDHSIQVVAEGVERLEEYEAVKSLGVHLSQGFYFLGPNQPGKRLEQATR